MSKQEIMAKMNAAADAAEQDLVHMMKEMAPDQKVGAQTLARWLKDNYMQAGYKRLSRAIFRRVL